MSDADRVALRYVEEGSFGVTPTGVLLAQTDIDAAAADNSYNDASSGFVTAGFVAGQTIYVTGFTEAANNGYKHIVSVAAGKIIVEETLALEAAGDTINIYTALEDLRFTGESLKQETESKESDEIRDDRQVAEIVRTAIRSAGGFNFELSYETYDRFLRALLFSAGWSTVAADTQITFSMASGDNSINDSGSGFVVAGFAAGQWVKISGFTETANNGFFKLESVAAGKMVLSGGTVATEAAGDTVTITMGAQLVNGVTYRSFSLEKEFTDIASEFTRFVGLRVSQLQMSINAESIITGSWSFMGKSETSATATLSGATPNPVNTNPIIETVEDVESVLENQAEASVLGLEFTITNNLRNCPVVGVLGPNEIKAGRVGVTGTAKMYFASKTIMDKYRNWTSSSLATIITDDDGNSYILEFPAIKYVDGTQVAGGVNTDIIADMSFTSFMDSGEQVTIRVAKFPGS